MLKMGGRATFTFGVISLETLFEVDFQGAITLEPIDLESSFFVHYVESTSLSNFVGKHFDVTSLCDVIKVN